MFKLPLSIVARFKFRFGGTYSIGLESPDKEVAEKATAFMRSAIAREVDRMAVPDNLADGATARPFGEQAAEPAGSSEERAPVATDYNLSPKTRAERKLSGG